MMVLPLLALQASPALVSVKVLFIIAPPFLFKFFYYTVPVVSISKHQLYHHAPVERHSLDATAYARKRPKSSFCILAIETITFAPQAQAETQTGECLFNLSNTQVLTHVYICGRFSTYFSHSIRISSHTTTHNSHTSDILITKRQPASSYILPRNALQVI